MTRERISENIIIEFKPEKHPEWRRIRTTPEMIAYLDAMGAETVTRCNADLHAAQAARKQPVEDGYDHTVTTRGTRARLYIDAFTARSMAHEAVNNAILKNLPIGTPPPPPPDHEIPRELGRRSAESRNLGTE